MLELIIKWLISRYGAEALAAEMRRQTEMIYFLPGPGKLIGEWIARLVLTKIPGWHLHKNPLRKEVKADAPYSADYYRPDVENKTE